MQGDERGFVLAAALWFVALLALAAVVIEGWIAAALDRGSALDDRVAAQSALVSAEQHIAFDLALGSTSARGIELAPHGAAPPGREAGPEGQPDSLPQGPFLALDERPYRLGDVMIRLQDGAGLCDLNTAGPDAVRRVLQSYGISVSRAETLANALWRYQKKPAAGGGDGAIEDAEYRRDGLPLPRHTPLLTPWEVLRIPGWEESEALWRGATPFYDIATPGPIGGLNANTASARMLTALGGMDERAAARIVQRRAAEPITDLSGFATAARGAEDHAVGLRPSNIVRVKLIVPGEPLMRVIEARLTPSGAAPFRVDYVVDLPPDLSADISEVAPLPNPPAAAGGEPR